MDKLKKGLSHFKTSIRQHPFRWFIRFSVAFFIFSIYQVNQRVESLKVYFDATKVPPHDIALLLGTAKRYEGFPNVFYDHRIQAALRLYRAGKVKGFLISGDNSLSNYDEPTDMKNDLIKGGVPEEYINLDYAGFDTYDSVVRAEKIFDLKRYIVISQAFHVKRALYIAQSQGHQAIGYAPDALKHPWSNQMKLREILARYKAFLEVTIYSPGPTFLGPKVKVKMKH